MTNKLSFLSRSGKKTTIFKEEKSNMKAKKLLSLLLVFVLVVGLLPMSAFAANFSDTEGHWAEAAIDRWSSYGVVNGVGDGKFDPDGTMTRAQAAQVFTKLMGLTGTAGAMTFSDVPANAWYADAVAKVTAAGIMNGVGNGLMNPEGYVTREQFFVMFARAMGLKEQSTTSGPRADGDSWANGYINALTDKGYVKGDGNGVNALANINRASVMSLLDQTIKQYVNTSGSTTLTATSGVVLVAAKDVTLTGTTAADIVIAQGADNGTVAFEKATVTGAITAQAANAKITSDKDSKITTPVINGANTTYTPATTTSAGGSPGGPGPGPSEEPETPASDTITSDLSEKEYGEGAILEIGAAVGDGEITLTRVSVPTLRVKGGGASTVNLVECDIDTIIVNKETSGGYSETPRILLKDTSVETVTATGDATIEADATSANPVTIGTINADKKMELKGASVEEVKTTSATSQVTLTSGSVQTVTATSGGEVKADGAAIVDLQVGGGATVSGTAQIEKVTVTSGTATIDAAVKTVEAAASATVDLGASAVIDDVKAEGTLTITSTAGSAGEIKNLTVTTGTITIAAATATIEKVTAAKVETADSEPAQTAPTISVTSGQIKEVEVNVPNTEIKATSTSSTASVAKVTAYAAATVDASAVQEVAINSNDAAITVTKTATTDNKVLDITVGEAVTSEVKVDVSQVSSSAAQAEAAVALTGTSMDAGKVALKTDNNGPTKTMTAIKWVDADATSNNYSINGVTKSADAYKKNATCTETGYQWMVGKQGDNVVVNNDTDKVATYAKKVTIPAKGHDWSTEGTVTKAATHIAAGVKTYTCKNDSSHSYPEPIPATGKHDTPETYTHDASAHWYVCAADSTVFNKSAHNWVKKTTVNDSKVTVTDVCSVCGYEGSSVELVTQAYLELAYTTNDKGVKTLAEGANELVNSNSRSFYKNDGTGKDMTVKIMSTLPFDTTGAVAKANDAYTNWTIAGKASDGLTLTKVELADDSMTATLTFTPKDTDNEAEGNQYRVSGALRIYAASAAFAKVGDEAVTAFTPDRDNGVYYVAAGVPGAAAPKSYTVSVNQYGVSKVYDGTEEKTESVEENGETKTVTVTVPKEATGTLTYYLVPAGIMAIKPISTLAKSTYMMTTKEAIENDLKVTASITTLAAAAEAEAAKAKEAKGEASYAITDPASIIASKKLFGAGGDFYGWSLVAVKYNTTAVTDKNLLDGYGASAAINVRGDSPETLSVKISNDGKVTVTKSVTTTDATTGAVTTTSETVSDAKLYLLDADKVPALDTLDTQTALEQTGAVLNNKSFTGDLAKSQNDKVVVAVLYGANENVGENTSGYVTAVGTATVAIKDIDDVIDEGIAAVNATMKTGSNAYAELTRAKDSKAITIRIIDAEKKIGTVDEGVYADVITPLVNKLDANKDLFGITQIDGKNGNNAGTLTLAAGEATTASAIVKFVKDVMGDGVTGATEIGTLAGTSITLTLKKDDKALDGGEYTLTFALQDDAAFKTALDTALNDAIGNGTDDSKINATIKEYGKVELSEDEVAVTITDGSVLIGTVKTNVVEKLATALTEFNKNQTWGTVTLSDAKNPETTLAASGANSGTITEFVTKLKYGSETNETLGEALKNSAKITNLDGKSVQITVTSEKDSDTKTATYTFAFNVYDVPAIVADAIDTANNKMKDDETPYAVMYLTEARGDEITVEIPENSTKQIGDIKQPITDMIQGLITKNQDKIEKLTTTKGELTAAAETDDKAVQGFVATCFTDLSGVGGSLTSLDKKTASLKVVDKAGNETAYNFTFKTVSTPLSTVTNGVKGTQG